MKIEDYCFETVENSSYLGSKITADNSYDLKITVSLETSQNRVKALTLQDYDLATPYVFLKDLGSWQKNCELLAAFKGRRTLWRTFGAEWTINNRLVVDRIWLNKLRWVGHLIRIGDDNTARKVFKDNIYGRKRRRGRTFLKCRDGVGQNAKQLLGISNW